MSSRKKNKKQKVEVNVVINQIVIVKKQNSKWRIWMLLGSLLWILVEILIYPVIGEIVTRLPQVINITETLIELLSS